MTKYCYADYTITLEELSPVKGWDHAQVRCALTKGGKDVFASDELYPGIGMDTEGEQVAADVLAFVFYYAEEDFGKLRPEQVETVLADWDLLTDWESILSGELGGLDDDPSIMID